MIGGYFQNTITKAAIITTPTMTKTGMISFESPPLELIVILPEPVLDSTVAFIYIPFLGSQEISGEKEFLSE